MERKLINNNQLCWTFQIGKVWRLILKKGGNLIHPTKRTAIHVHSKLLALDNLQLHGLRTKFTIIRNYKHNLKKMTLQIPNQPIKAVVQYTKYQNNHT